MQPLGQRREARESEKRSKAGSEETRGEEKPLTGRGVEIVVLGV